MTDAGPPSRRAARYAFVSHWRVPGRIQDVFAILTQAQQLPDWWPSVYLGVEELARGAPDGLGHRLALTTRGWLPYTLRWHLTVTGITPPERLSLSAGGDLEGQGTWILSQDGDDVRLRYEWEVLANKALLKYLSPLLRPVFALNHRWAMARGETSLRLELARRQALSPEAAARIPPPPGPASDGRVWALLASSLSLFAAGCWLFLRFVSSKDWSKSS